MIFGIQKIAMVAMLCGPCIAFAALLDEPIKPLPETLNQDPARVELGRRLFHDTRLSANSSLSCASCHNLTRGGADSREHAIGFDGKSTAVNVPTVLNAAFNFR